MDVAVRVKQHLRNIRPRTRIAHVIQRRNPPHRQREQQVIRLIELLLGIEGGVVQPLLDGHGQDVEQHEVRAGIADAEVAVRVNMGDIEGGGQASGGDLLLPEAERAVVRLENAPWLGGGAGQAALGFEECADGGCFPRLMSGEGRALAQFGKRAAISEEKVEVNVENAHGNASFC